MRESKLFVNFLRTNLLVILIPAIIFGSLGWWWEARKPDLYTSEAIFELTQRNSYLPVDQSINVLDHLVTMARSANFGSSLGLAGDQIGAVRFSPFGYKLMDTSENESSARTNLGNVIQYIQTTFNSKNTPSGFTLSKVGQLTVTVKRPNTYLGLVVGSLCGFFAGLIVALIRTYFSKA